MSGIMGKFRDMLKQPEEELDYEDYYGDGKEPETKPIENFDIEDDVDEEEDDTTVEEKSTNSNNVINIHDSSKVQFVLFKPESFDKDVTTIADELIKKHTVILNLEQTNKDIARRIIDFLGGVAYANNGKVSKVAEDTYIVMPSNVSLSGEDAMDEVESENIYF